MDVSSMTGAPAGAPKELLTALEPLRALAERRDAAQERLWTLEHDGLEAARRADIEAYAAAIAASRDDPGPTGVDEVEAEVASLRREAAALDLATATAAARVTELAESRREAWAAETSKRAEAARSKYARAVESLARARTELDEARACDRWVTGFPGARLSGSGAGWVKGVPTANGEPLAWTTLIAALRSDAEG